MKRFRSLLIASICLLSSAGAEASTDSAACSVSCSAAAPVVARVVGEQPATYARGELIDPRRYASGKDVPGLWRGETPSPGVFRLWASSVPANILGCPDIKAGEITDHAGAAHPAYVISKPVLDAAGREALVAVRYESGQTGSYDHLYFLRKVSGRWVIAGEGELAVS